MAFSLLSLALALAPAPQADVAGQLALLASSQAEVRVGAERWLSANLEPGHLDDVARTLLQGGAEERLRIVRALGADDRHLELAVLLATDLDGDVASVGREAIAGLVVRWSASARDAPLSKREMPDAWREGWTRPIALEVCAGDFQATVERLDRLGAGPAPLVVDPGLVSVEPRREARAEGAWADVVAELVRRRRVSFEVLGHRDAFEEGADRARPWVRLCLRADEDVGDTTRHLVDWCLGAVREYDPEANRACARALAATGWPAALAWLEARWTERGDPAALEAVLYAAERGNVVPSLARPARVRALLGEFDRRLAEADDGAVSFAERGARALAVVGPLGAAGESLDPLFLEGFDTLSAPSRWVRLVALERHARRSPAAAARCRAILADAAVHPAVRLQALRALPHVAEPGGEPVPIAGTRSLFERAGRDGGTSALGQLLLATAAVPLDDPGPPADAEGRAARLVWAEGRGDHDGARRILVATLAADGAEELAAALRPWVGLGLGAELARLATEARSASSGGAPWRHFTIRSGLADADQRRALLAEVLAAERRGLSLLDLGDLAGDEGEVGERARSALVAALRDGLEDDALLPALERAFAGLRRARRAAVEEAFLGEVASTAARSRHPLATTFFTQGWPRVPGPPPVRLEDRDRRWK